MLSIDLRGKRAFVAGIADDKGYGWAIAKALKKAGATIVVGTWPPALGIFTKSLERGKLDVSLDDGDGELSFEKIYPFDAVYDSMADVPEEIKTNKRYVDVGDYSIEGTVNAIVNDFGEQGIDIVVHSLANGSEVKNPLIETSRKGYLEAISASSYSFVKMVQTFSPLMKPGGSFLAMTYLASEQVIPGYGGGMSTAKAALESDTRVLSFEAGRIYNHRVNVISAGPLGSRAAKAIGFMGHMISYSEQNSPLEEPLVAGDIGAMAAFLSSDLAKAITGTTLYVDKGLHIMGKSAPKYETEHPDKRSVLGLPPEK